MKVSKRFLLFAVALVVCLVAAPITSVEAGGSTRLTGTLTIEFSVGVDNPDIEQNFTFTIADQVKVAGITIPASIRGGTFEVNALCPGPSLDSSAGRALLRVKNAQEGTVFKAFVTSGAFGCLFVIGATRVGGSGIADPFITNGLNSAIGEDSVWFAQILQSTDGVIGTDNEDDMRAFFSIPPARTEIRFRVTTIKSSQTGAPAPTNNRGGSAAGINNSAVDLLFKNP